jgi:hypothetical protein
MALTKTDLRDAVAEELGIKRAEETLSAADAVLIERRIEGVHEYLLGEGLVYWDIDDVPDAVREPMTMIVASRAAPAFGIQYAGGPEGTRLLRIHSAQRGSSEPVKAEYF